VKRATADLGSSRPVAESSADRADTRRIRQAIAADQRQLAECRLKVFAALAAVFSPPELRELYGTRPDRLFAALRERTDHWQGAR
jgi:hypothetical protein